MREQVKGGETHGRPVGGGDSGGGGGGGGGLGVERVWKSLDIHKKHNKAGTFYIKKKRDWPFFSSRHLSR